MILLLVLAAWILLASAVLALCMAARAGDRVQPANPHADSRSREPLLRERFEYAENAAQPSLRPAETGPLLRRDGVAA
jgi:hypothetical protein